MKDDRCVNALLMSHKATRIRLFGVQFCVTSSEKVNFGREKSPKTFLCAFFERSWRLVT